MINLRIPRRYDDDARAVLENVNDLAVRVSTEALDDARRTLARVREASDAVQVAHERVALAANVLTGAILVMLVMDVVGVIRGAR